MRPCCKALTKHAVDTMNTLDAVPRAYTKELYNAKCDVLFEHVYESYVGEGKSVYSVAA